MKKYVKIIALLLVCTLAIGIFASCKDKKTQNTVIGKINGEIIPDGVYINNFADIIYEESMKEDPVVDFTLTGMDLYNALTEAKKDGKSYYEIYTDEALKRTKRFMIEYQTYSGKEGWPDEAKISEMRESSTSYISQMYNYYGLSMGATSEQDFAQVAYNMTYDNLMEYLIMSSSLEAYKSSLQEAVNPSDDELTMFYSENISDYYTVQVRHSLINTEEMDEDEKKAAYDKAVDLINQYNSGTITFDDIVKESDDTNSSTGEVNNDGYYTVYSGAGFVEEFEEWGVKQTEVSTKLEIVETTYGYHIMQCTKIYDLTDEDLKSRVLNGYKFEYVESQVDAEIAPLLENSKYDIKELNRAYVEKITKRIFTGDFSDTEGAASTATASPTATPTEKPEYDDAAADTTVVAKYKGQDIYKVYYIQFFSQAMNHLFADYDFSDMGDTNAEFLENLKEIMQREYKDGKTYMEYAKEDALNQMLKFFATKDMAVAADKAYTDEEKATMLEELDSQIDIMLSYYGSSYGASTRDEFMLAFMGTNVNDYKMTYIDQMLVSEYSNELIAEIEAEESALKSFYDENADDYRVVTIRHITKFIVDKEGNLVSDEDQADVLKLVEALKTKLENGDSAEALVEGYSEASDVTSAKGLLDLTSTSTSISEEVIDWAFDQTEVGAVTIIKTDSSYELVVIEGFVTYEEAKGVTASSSITVDSIKEAIETEYKNIMFDESIEKYVADNNLAFTDIQQDVIDAVAEKYFEYEEESDEEDIEATATATATAAQ